MTGTGKGPHLRTITFVSHLLQHAREWLFHILHRSNRLAEILSSTSRALDEHRFMPLQLQTITKHEQESTVNFPESRSPYSSHANDALISDIMLQLPSA